MAQVVISARGFWEKGDLCGCEMCNTEEFKNFCVLSDVVEYWYSVIEVGQIMTFNSLDCKNSSLTVFVLFYLYLDC